MRANSWLYVSQLSLAATNRSRCGSVALTHSASADPPGAPSYEKIALPSPEPFLELDDGATDRWVLAFERHERADHVLDASEMLMPRRHEHAGFAEDLTTPGLRAEMPECRVASIEGKAKANGERALERGRGEARQMRGRRIVDERPDPGHEVWTR